MTPLPAEDDPRFVDLVDDLLTQLLDGLEPDLQAAAARHPEMADRTAEALDIASEVAGRRQSPRPSLHGYEILRELGRGGMGTVYLARLTSLDREVALKVLPHSFGLSPRSRQRFLEEARALAKTHHGNIVGIHRIVDDGEVLAFEMEFIDGPSLQHVLDHLRAHKARGESAPSLGHIAELLGLPAAALGARNLVQFFVRLIAKIASALGVVHAAGLIHRDVKPANVLLRRNGEPVLVDFGLVRPMDRDVSRLGSFAGTPVYSAPEQLRGDASVGPPVDVYALAVTLFECLTLTKPFPGNTTTELLARIESGLFVPLRRLAPGTPRDLETIVAHAMQVDPARRYPNAAAFADDVQRLLDLQPIRARPVGPLPRFVKLLRRKRSVLLGGCFGAALVIAAMVPILDRVEAGTRRRDEALQHVLGAQQRLIGIEGRHLLAQRAGASEPATRVRDPLHATTAPLRAAIAEYDEALALDPANAASRRERDVASVALWLRELRAPDLAAVRAACEGREFRELTSGLGPHTTRAARTLALGRDETTVPLAPPSSASAGDRTTLGLLAFLVGDFRLCEDAWQDLVPSAQNQPLLDAALGVVHLSDGMPDLAYLRLREANRHFGGSAPLLAALAEAAIALGDLTLARQWLQQLDALRDAEPSPGTVRFRRRLELDLLTATGSDGDLASGYQELVELDPTDPTPRHRLAQLALRSGDLQAAARGLDALLQGWPEVARYRLDRARVALQQRNLPDYAREVFEVLAQDFGRGRPRGAVADLLEILRIGGLSELYREGMTATASVRSGRAFLGGEIPILGFAPKHIAANFEPLLRLVHDVRERSAALRQPGPGLGGGAAEALITAPLAMARLPVLNRFQDQPLRALLAFLPQAAVALHPHFTRSLREFEAWRTGGRLTHVPIERVELPERESLVFGHAMVPVDDCNADGVDDVLVSALSSNPAEAGAQLVLVDGRNGAVLQRLPGDSDDHLFGFDLAAIGDVDGDGRGDWLIGAPARVVEVKQGRAEVWSGKSMQRLHSLVGDGPGFGVAVCDLGDVDGDQVPDFAVATAPMLRNTAAQGRVQVFSGASLQVLRCLDNDVPGVWYGACIASTRDVNGDGVGDLIVGGNFGGAAGLVRLYCGRTGTLLQAWSDPSPTSGFGTAVLGAGDVDGDGSGDIVVTAVRTDDRSGLDQVFVYSGATGRQLALIEGGRAGSGFGMSVELYSRSAVESVLAIGSPFRGASAAGAVEFWTSSGERLATLLGPTTTGRFGSRIVRTNDCDGDGQPELFVSGDLPDRSGSVWRAESRSCSFGW